MAQPTCGECGQFPNHRPGSPVCVAQSRDEWRDRAERAEARVKELEVELSAAAGLLDTFCREMRKRGQPVPVTERRIELMRAVLDGGKP